MAQNEMRAKAGLPERVRLNEGLGGEMRCMGEAYTNGSDSGALRRRATIAREPRGLFLSLPGPLEGGPAMTPELQLHKFESGRGHLAFVFTEARPLGRAVLKCARCFYCDA